MSRQETPCKTTFPPREGDSLESVLNKVVFPTPEGPEMRTQVPEYNGKEIVRGSCEGPEEKERFTASNRGSVSLSVMSGFGVQKRDVPSRPLLFEELSPGYPGKPAATRRSCRYSRRPVPRHLTAYFLRRSSFSRYHSYVAATPSTNGIDGFHPRAVRRPTSSSLRGVPSSFCGSN